MFIIQRSNVKVTKKLMCILHFYSFIGFRIINTDEKEDVAWKTNKVKSADASR